jgi:hypothetical protein
MQPGFASKRFGSTTFEILKWTYKDPSTGKKEPKTNQCATFPTHLHGAAAMFVLMDEGKTKPKGSVTYRWLYRDQTIAEAIKTWCGDYWADGYTAHMFEQTGLKPTSILTQERIRDPDVAVSIARAIAMWERGKPYPEQLTEAEWHQAHAMAFSGAVAPAPSHENDVPLIPPAATSSLTIAQRVKRAYQAFWASVSAIGSVGVVGAISGEQSYLPAVPQGLSQSVKNVGGWTDLVSGHTWQMLLFGAAAFGAVAVIQKVRNG